MSSPSDRVGLVTDAYALVKANKILSPESLIKLMVAYKDEDDCVVWQGLSAAIGGLNSVLSADEKLHLKYTNFAKMLVLPLYEKIGWEANPDDGHLTSILRGLMVGLLCEFCSDDEDVMKQAKTKCEAFFEDPTNSKILPGDIKGPVFKIYLKNGGKNEYETVKAYYYKAKDSAEKKTVLGSLGSTSDEGLKLETLDWTTSGEVKLQDFFYAIGSVSGSGKQGREIAWTYFQANHERLQAMIANASPSLMDAVIMFSAGRFATLEKAEEITNFFKEHPYPKNERKIAQLIESMNAAGKMLVILQESELSKPQFWDTYL